MAKLTRTELKALWASASPRYKEFWDKIADSANVLKDNDLVYRARVFGNAAGIALESVQESSLGVSVTWARLSTGQYQVAVGGGVDYAKLNVQLTMLDGATAFRLVLNDEDSPVFKVYSFNSSNSFVDGAVFFVTITYNP